MRAYIAGPMSGYPDLNFFAFDEARDFLIAAGWEVISPADMDREKGIVPGETEITEELYADAMRRDIEALCNVDAIVFLPGWKQSRGAQIESQVAEWIGLKRLFLHHSYAVVGLELSESQYAA